MRKVSGLQKDYETKNGSEKRELRVFSDLLHSITSGKNSEAPAYCTCVPALALIRQYLEGIKQQFLQNLWAMHLTLSALSAFFFLEIDFALAPDAKISCAAECKHSRIYSQPIYELSQPAIRNAQPLTFRESQFPDRLCSCIPLIKFGPLSRWLGSCSNPRAQDLILKMTCDDIHCRFWINWVGLHVLEISYNSLRVYRTGSTLGGPSLCQKLPGPSSTIFWSY
jgi:hypothetical protein